MNSAGNSRINCATARQHFSAYHDGELPPDLRLAMAEHIEGCIECARRIAEFAALSRATSELPATQVPSEIWPQLEKTLLAEARNPAAPYPRWRTIPRTRLWAGLAAAAIVLILIPSAFVAWRFYSGDHGHGHMAINFGRYLNELGKNPDEAQQVLLASYGGRAVSVDEAARQLRYRPVAPDELPDGTSLEALYLLHMPCCLCVQAVYKDSNGERLAVFEHVDDQPIWFGSRPTIQTRCNGIPTSIVQVDDHLAASWQRQGRYVTVIGASNVEQVAQLMAFFDQQPGNR